ncbi:MAG: hypothetical protein ACI9EQ_001098 [Bacteroidia bacterium]
MNTDLRRYLKDTELDKKLATEGFVVVPMLNLEEVASLRNTFLEVHEEQTEAFYASGHHQSSEFRKLMSESISAVLKPYTSELFEKCDVLGASFISKAPNSESSLQPHQDWNIVDEHQFRSFNIWIPLVDLTPENGAIEVLPKSHNWVRGYRHSSIDCAYKNVHHLVWKNMQPLYLKAGEALIYDHALLHASKANKTDKPRIACAIGVMPSEAQMYFYWDNKGAVEQYESNPDFFMTENIFDGPGSLKKVADLAYDFPAVDVDDFYKFLGKEPPQKVVRTPIIKTDSTTETKPSFWQVYTPMNIIREINYRLTSKK